MGSSHDRAPPRLGGTRRGASAAAPITSVPLSCSAVVAGRVREDGRRVRIFLRQLGDVVTVVEFGFWIFIAILIAILFIYGIATSWG